MIKNEYKLSKSLYGHSLDVRSVAITPNNDIISGSRDKTAKLWKFDPFQQNYVEVMTYKDQQNFVASVLYLDPTEEFPDGLIITGGNDHVVLIYKPSEPFATFTIKEHSNTVSCLSKANDSNCFLSGSWDTTAKCFKISSSPKCIAVYSGHNAAVWNVIQLKINGNIVTASADKTIGIWQSNGQKIQSLTGHTDCVRSLADFPELNRFISVANDASIKVWESNTGENIATYYGHTNYIYSIARCSKEGPDCFVTSDEDRTVKVWSNGLNTDNIILPAQSVWAVNCLENGDIVTGSSDGVVRVFTKDTSRYADEAALKKFDEEVEALQQQSVQEIGGVKVSDLPGREALYEPGKKAGQMQMIREGGKVLAYTWVADGDNSHWDPVGEVMGGTNKDSQGKTMFEGKAYDFVFSVDVEEGKPPLKLPYNQGDDVYQTANKFLSKHFLPADYLEQVVDFILKNSKQQYVSPATNSDYQDPFTGGNRYTPSYSSNSNMAGVNVDPFTGGSSYSSTTVKASTSSTITSSGNADPFTGGSSYSTTTSHLTYFPMASYRSFDTADLSSIIKKLKEFNQKVSTDHQVSNSNLESLEIMCKQPITDLTSYELLMQLLSWPEDVIFPVLDVIRIAVKNQTNNEMIVTFNDGIIINKLMKLVESKIVNNTILTLRCICNLCIHEAGENLVYDKRFEILEKIMSFNELNKNAQIALSTTLLNIAILFVKKQDDLGYSVLSQILPDTVVRLTDPESHFRAYVTMGTLITKCQSSKQELVAKINENQQFMAMLQQHCLGEGKTELENKRASCAKELRQILLL